MGIQDHPAKQAKKLLKRMKESSSETITAAPKVQKLERLQTIEKEHKDALERAVSLNVPHAVNTSDDAPVDRKLEETLQSETENMTETRSKPTSGRTNWDHVVQKLFKKNESGNIQLNRESRALK